MRKISLICCSIFLIFASQGQAQGEFSAIRNLFDSGEFALAESRIENALMQKPQNAELHLLYGMTLLQRVGEVSVFRKLGVARRGREALNRAIELDPLLTEARKELSDDYYYAPAIAGGDKARAAVLIEEIESYDEFFYLMTISSRELDEGAASAAKEHLERAIELSPRSKEAHLQLGIALRELENYDDAILAFREALSIDDRFALARFHIGLIGLLSESHITESIQAFQEYIERVSSSEGPFLDQAYYRLGSLLEKNNQPQKASENYHLSLSINPAYEPAQRALEKLNN
jgi:tetratricopeptide (TPR) repeat protein